MSLTLKSMVREPLVTVGALTHGLATRPQVLWQPARHLLVVGHMRSNTTVLSYILGSHPHIVGAAENHQAYRRGLDLIKLRCRLLRKHVVKPGVQFYLDKLLHDRHVLSDSLLARPDVEILFLLRKPDQTLRSILAMGRNPGEPACHSDPEWVTRYYEQRMVFMADCARRLVAQGGQARARVLTAETFLDRPDAVLANLSSQLRLTQPLSQNYEVFSFTGRRGAGDRSENIRAGSVVRQATDYSDLVIDDALLNRARLAYAEGLAALRRQVGDVA